VDGQCADTPFFAHLFTEFPLEAQTQLRGIFLKTNFRGESMQAISSSSPSVGAATGASVVVGDTTGAATGGSKIVGDATGAEEVGDTTGALVEEVSGLPVGTDPPIVR